MAVNLTTEQILALAPDPASIKAGRDLSTPRKWSSLGFTDVTVWGECQGSGSMPYQVRIDLVELAFKCSCPSRKFPCKHSLGLMLLLVEQNAAFTSSAMPAWVTEWMDERQARSQKKAAKSDDETDKDVDPVAQAKRLEQRKQKVSAGVAELDKWLQDLFRQGLASLRSKPFSFWELMVARLIDSQAPGLARLVRDCAGISSTGEGWQERLAESLGRIYLLVEAFNRIETLPNDLQDEIKSIVGFTVSQEELLKGEGVVDLWKVVGQRVEKDDKLKTQRTWLYGERSRRWALVLSFAHGAGMLDTTLIAGHEFEGELVYYPGSFPLRTLVKNRAESAKSIYQLSGHNVDEALKLYSEALSLNPWIERFPMTLNDVTPTYKADDQWFLMDSAENAVRMSIGQLSGWQLMSLSCGKPISIFGEYNEQCLAPLAVSVDQ